MNLNFGEHYGWWKLQTVLREERRLDSSHESTRLLALRTGSGSFDGPELFF